MKHVIGKANIVRTRWPGLESLEDRKYVNLYLGSGRFGGCFDPYGLMNRSYSPWVRDCIKKMKYSGQWESARMANTVFMHADHWSRGTYGLDHHLPVARFTWAGELEENVGIYRQELDIHSGRLSTSMELPQASLKLTSCFNPYNRDIFAMQVEYNSASGAALPAMMLLPQTEVFAQYENYFKGSFTSEGFNSSKNCWMGRLKIGTADTVLNIRVLSSEGSVSVEQKEEGLKMAFIGSTGSHLILFGVAGHERKNELESSMDVAAASGDYLNDCSEAWHKRWGDSWVEIPDDRYQAFWFRSVYYFLCSYSPDADCVAPPNGWTGNGWLFHFPQDFSYIHPALLRLGHLDIAKAKVDFYFSRLPEVKRSTKHIYGTDGALWIWEFPIGPGFDLYKDAAPNTYQFEIHNGAYPARMAYETALYMKDDKWARKVAWPVVSESTRFYASAMTREPDGTWGLHIKPAMGQDEAGGFNAGNYLCSLFSAKYCLETAIKLAERLGIKNDEVTGWKKLLTDGLAFTRVYSRDLGLYYSCDEALFGNEKLVQKHPVQLNPLIFLPLEDLDEPTKKAYTERYNLCYGVKEDFIPGWTLGAYWLASAHMQDGDAMLGEFEQIVPKNNSDDDMLQIYESSRYYWMQYYTTTHGLFIQAVNDALLSDYWGEVKVGSACPKAWKKARFNNLYTMDGGIWTGELTNGKWAVNGNC